ncbi:MAG: 1-aminocyclopropane-1-carboxylate deaminase/D-cysteine desulfhydrase [Lawsonibacter sp.]
MKNKIKPDPDTAAVSPNANATTKVKFISKLSLGYYPTPLEELTRLGAKHGNHRIYIKRDDMTGPATGGNKTRKLEYILREALDQGCSAILTLGGPQTNHGRTTVAAAIQCGLKPILVLGGKKPDYLSGNLTLDAMMGAELVFSDDREATAKQVISEYEARGEKVYYMPAGGSSPTGVAGYIMAVPELMKQLEERDIHPKYVLCAVGSQGTFDGLLLGAKYFHAPFEVVGVPVAPLKEHQEEGMAAFMNEVSRIYEMGVTVSPHEVRLFTGPADCPYPGFAYSVPDPATRAVMMEVAKEEGVILDPVYTGKAFRGMLDLLDQGILDGDVVFVHTGGAAAVWTQEHLNAAQDELYANCTIREI